MASIKVVVDAAVPFIEGVLEPYAEVVYRDDSDIAPSDVADADALIIRTRTHCDETLLKDSKVKIIATATIGTDHIDTAWCDSHGIMVCNAAGCNSAGVMQYVFSALYGAASRAGADLSGKTMGIIGVGSVGKRVEQMAHALGFKVLRNDPPRAAAEGAYGFCSLDQLLQESDIVTLHVPLNQSTESLACRDFFSKMKAGAFFINASRGEVVDESALLDASPKLGPIIIDTWRNEPNINLELLEKTAIATPHIAGYSFQGKLNSAAYSVRAVARFFGIKRLYEFFPKADMTGKEAVKLDFSGKNQGEIAAMFQYNYPVFTDDFLFRLDPSKFEQLRKNYNYRREVYV